MRPCDVDGCRNPHEARGYCRTHYSRWQRHGDTDAKFVRSTLTITELVEEIDWLLGGGVSPELVCESLRVTPGTLRRRLQRAGFREMAELFQVRHAA